MTANAFVEDKAQCLDAGMNDFVAKPVNPPSLFSTLLNWLPPRGPVLTTPPAETTRSVNDRPTPRVSLLGLDGPELERAIQILGGNFKEYVRLLNDFSERHRDDVAKIEALLTQDNRETARQFAHGLKGAAGSLGLARLQAAANELDAALRGNPDDTATLATLVEGVARELAIVENARANLPVEATDVPVAAVDPDRVRQLLDQLETLLAADDTAASELVSANRDLLHQAFGMASDELIQQVDSYNYKAGLATLRKLRAQADQ